MLTSFCYNFHYLLNKINLFSIYIDWSGTRVLIEFTLITILTVEQNKGNFQPIPFPRNQFWAKFNHDKILMLLRILRDIEFWRLNWITECSITCMPIHVCVHTCMHVHTHMHKHRHTQSMWIVMLLSAKILIFFIMAKKQICRQ